MAQAPDLQFHIRYATASDNTLLAQVGAETFYDRSVADNTPQNMASYLAASFSPEKQAQELANPASRFLIAEVADVTVGYAHFKFGPAPTAIVGRKLMEIVRFYARQAWIGKGVGARLMRACLREAERVGCNVVWLSVWEQNSRAIAFYRQWGFVEVGRQVFQLGEDPQRDLLMARAISLEVA